MDEHERFAFFSLEDFDKYCQFASMFNTCIDMYETISSDKELDELTIHLNKNKEAEILLLYNLKDLRSIFILKRYFKINKNLRHLEIKQMYIRPSVFYALIDTLKKHNTSLCRLNFNLPRGVSWISNEYLDDPYIAERNEELAKANLISTLIRNNNLRESIHTMNVEKINENSLFYLLSVNALIHIIGYLIEATRRDHHSYSLISIMQGERFLNFEWLKDIEYDLKSHHKKAESHRKRKLKRDDALRRMKDDPWLSGNKWM